MLGGKGKFRLISDCHPDKLSCSLGLMSNTASLFLHMQIVGFLMLRLISITEIPKITQKISPPGDQNTTDHMHDKFAPFKIGLRRPILT